MDELELRGDTNKRQKRSANAPFSERPSVSPTITVPPTNVPDNTNISSSHTEPDESNNYIEVCTVTLEI